MHCERVDTIGQLRESYWLLEQACERLNEREERRHFAPDLYAALLRGEASMILVVDHAPVGCFVTFPSKTPGGEPALHVWIAYATPDAPADAILVGAREAELMAAEQGLGSMVFSTQRVGWTRRAAALGYKLSEFVYTKEVSL